MTKILFRAHKAGISVIFACETMFLGTKVFIAYVMKRLIETMEDNTKTVSDAFVWAGTLFGCLAFTIYTHH